MEIKISTLSENTSNSGYLAEHGLSIFIEVDGLRVLFDTGAGISAVHNAQLMGIDLLSIDRIVLSHGHNDHTGGLREVLRRSGWGTLKQGSGPHVRRHNEPYYKNLLLN